MIKIGARKCTIKEIDFETTKNFLNKYHRQKSVYSIYNIGLFHESMLIGVMTFGYPRYNKRYQWELLRLCFHQEYRVVGGTQKMFNYFVDEYKPHSIISYCDYNYFTGDIYDKLGFELIRVSKGGKIWKKGDKFITDNLLRKFGADKLIGTNDGKNTNNEEILLREGWTYDVDENGQGTYIWNGEGKFGYVYLITDTLHNKKYVGQRKGYKLDEHYYGSGRIIQNLIKKYGTSIFKREIIDYASSQEELSRKEVEFIKKYNTLYPNGYNLTLRLQAVDPYERDDSNINNEECRKKSSERMKKLWTDDEYRNKMSQMSKDNWKNEDYRKNRTYALRKTTQTEEYRKKLSEIQKQGWDNERRKVRSELSKILWQDKDYRNKQTQIRKEKFSSEELKKEISERFKSKWQDEKYVKKVLDSRKKAYAKKEYREKLSRIRIGCKWWNNGFEQKFQKEKPDGDEWVLGRLKKK